jgi:uncharacterized SAM-binding protein YcdF (DUF218 family)
MRMFLGRHRAVSSARHLGVVLAGAFAAQAYALIETRPLQQWLLALMLAPLETRFDPTTSFPNDNIAGLIVLGGGHARLVEAVRIAREHPGLDIVVTGAGPTDDVMEMLGSVVDDRRILVDEKARNTYENAIFSAALVRRLGDDAASGRWLLVTSAVHMPRAVGVFRKVGLEIIAWPVSDARGKGARAMLPAVNHEWLGLMWYRALGRTVELFPAPGTRQVARS